jgi:hypothetical protein
LGANENPKECGHGFFFGFSLELSSLCIYTYNSMPKKLFIQESQFLGKMALFL